MSKPSRLSLTTVTAAAVLLILAATIVICDFLGDWNLFIPVIMMGLGLYIMVLGIWKGAGSPERLRRSERSFTMFWGNLVAIIGTMILINYWYPGNVLYIVIAFIIWLALALMLFGLKPKTPY